MRPRIHKESFNSVQVDTGMTDNRWHAHAGPQPQVASTRLRPPPVPPAPPQAPGAPDAPRPEDGIFVAPGALEANRVILVNGKSDALTLAACGYPAVGIASDELPHWLCQACEGREVLLAMPDDAQAASVREMLKTRLVEGDRRVQRLRPTSAACWRDWLTEDSVGLRCFLHGTLPREHRKREGALSKGD
jgi:hypothetical protein